MISSFHRSKPSLRSGGRLRGRRPSTRCPGRRVRALGGQFSSRVVGAGQVSYSAPGCSVSGWRLCVRLCLVRAPSSPLRGSHAAVPVSRSSVACARPARPRPDPDPEPGPDRPPPRCLYPRSEARPGNSGPENQSIPAGLALLRGLADASRPAGLPASDPVRRIQVGLGGHAVGGKPPRSGTRYPPSKNQPRGGPVARAGNPKQPSMPDISFRDSAKINHRDPPHFSGTESRLTVPVPPAPEFFWSGPHLPHIPPLFPISPPTQTPWKRALARTPCEPKRFMSPHEPDHP